jgi:hypothetical protein
MSIPSAGPGSPAGAQGGRKGLHVATLAHEGRIWDAYLELDDDPHRPDVCRAHVRFDPADTAGGDHAVSTGVIIIENSWEEAVAKARSFDERQMEGLLRSALPEAEE